MRPSESTAGIRIERVVVGPERVEASVRMGPQVPLRTSAVPGLVDIVVEALPGIVRHRCECGSARGVVAELADTEIPHLLEHVALEIMALSGSPRSLAGSTSWDFSADGRGVFRVALEYDDDLVALAALTEAARIVQKLADGDTRMRHVDAVIEKVRMIRSGGDPGEVS